MESASAAQGLGHLDQLSSLEERHRSLPFEEARQAVLTGGDDGWRVFVEKYSRFVYTVALRLAPGPEDQKRELAQDIYCRVFSYLQRNNFRVLRQFESRCKFTTYLFRMVQTARSAVLRKELRDAEHLDFVDFSDEVNRGIESSVHGGGSSEQAIPAFSAGRLREEISQILDGLSPREKVLIKLRFQKGLKLREMAETLGYRDTNDAAYALRKALKHFEAVAALDTGEWTDAETRAALDVLDQVLFQ